MDEDESLTTLLAMGFPDIAEIKNALRIAKNDLSEAVAILTNDHTALPSSSSTFGPSPRPQSTLAASAGDDVTMKDAAGDESSRDLLKTEDNFPLGHLYELESRVFQDNWSIPYKKGESLAILLTATAEKIANGSCDSDEHCQKFLTSILPEAFKKLLTSHATQRWQLEIQEGIFDMLELFQELVVTALRHSEDVPVGLLQILAMAFDVKNDWNLKNKDKSARGTWQTRGNTATCFAKSPLKEGHGYAHFGWLCDLVNQFGQIEGFELLAQQITKVDKDPRQLAAVMLPFSKCAEILVRERFLELLTPVVEKTFSYLETVDVNEVRGKEMAAISELLLSLKVLCFYLWPQHVDKCDSMRLQIILKMLKAPQFSAKMNALKEVSKLIEECRQKDKHNIPVDKVVEWMAENSVLSVSLEGNIDQIQYTDRIKNIVEFLGTRLSEDDLSRMWKLQKTANNPHVVENIYAILAGSASRFSLSQYEHLTSIVKETWQNEGGNDLVREKLVGFIGRLGKEANQVKSIQVILQLLWELAHMPQLSRQLVEVALQEHLSILSEATLNRDVMKRQYVMKCVDDIKKENENLIPSIKHLHDICKSYKNSTSFYQKQDKATLAELNKQHEIVKVLSFSLRSCHSAAVKSAKNQPPTPLTLVDGRYTHAEVVDIHLGLMEFLLKEGDLYLSWVRCRELWETLVDNEMAIKEDKNKLFVWFTECLTDLETQTQLELFKTKLLKLSPSDLTSSSFKCLKAYFESINLAQKKLRKSGNNLVVENQDLLGMNYFWRIVTDVTDEEIASLAIDYLLDLSYLSVNPKLKGKSANLHKEFISKCYNCLETILSQPQEPENIIDEGHEIETSMPSERSASEALMSISISNISSLPVNIRGQKLQKATRILQLAERYISSIETVQPSQRSILPHGATFRGRPLQISVHTDNNKEEFILESHSNEFVRAAKLRIGELMKQPIETLNFTCGDLEIGSSKDHCLVAMVGPEEKQTWVVNSNKKTTSTPSTSLMLFNENRAEGHASASASASVSSAQDELSRQDEESERQLPGVVMASGGTVFPMLYQLAGLADKKTVQSVKKLLSIIPTDPSVEESLEIVNRFASVSCSPAAANASPKLSPRNKVMTNEKENLRAEDVQEILRKLFDPQAERMNPFRVLYNLEVLSGRLMPTMKQSSNSNSPETFSTTFLNVGGLRIILHIMEKEALPKDVDYDIRQATYLVALQIADHLLCDEAFRTPRSDSALTTKPVITSPIIKPTPPKRSALDSSLNPAAKSPLVLSATKIVQTMSESEFGETIACLMRVAWAAAAGNLCLASVALQNMRQPEHPRFSLGRRSRDSSTGSSGSEGSRISPEPPQILHAGICAQQPSITKVDSKIAENALELLVTCLHMRSNYVSAFYRLPLVNEFIIDTVLGSSSEDVRKCASNQLIRLSKLKLTSRRLNLDSADGTSGDSPTTPKNFLTNLLLKTPVPLWIPSCKARGISHSLLGQCSEYFDLRCALLKDLSKKDQAMFDFSAEAMINDEITFLNNFTPCQRSTDCTLIAGHLKLVEALLTCEGVERRIVGNRLIPDLLSSFLFPASHIMTDTSLDISFKDVNPKCDTVQSRVAAYNLIVELCKKTSSNVKLVCCELIRMHHSFKDDLLKDFEYSPTVERRAESGFVGLKNAGATCYMNSVIQQLFCIPSLCEQILSIDIETCNEDSVFYQLQNLFGHLLESKLQYYAPEKFWNCFQLYGQPINVREQQDAFEFFTQIVDQADEFLSKNKKSKIFSQKFEGTFSDQKLCQGCPHRYEREETFMALNLPVKSGNLEDSLNQFVKGEVLEGDNAYFCEKCKLKRTTTKRMCIKTLPTTLVIQLKRFHYDWETNRALKFDDMFKFPWTLDMSPYTIQGMAGKSSKPAGAHNYELVGVVVHSGQASAGHYYSFIKDRQGRSDGKREETKKWFKFNDTTVESFEMTEEALANECFGGSYKVKKDGKSSTSLPEKRQRYWNAYILFYEAIQSQPTKLRASSESIQNRKSFSQSFSKLSGSGVFKKDYGHSLSSASVAQKQSEPRGARESLSQLSDLLEKGEKRGLFSNHMPASIERGIQEENLRFMENRDVYCDEYYRFIYEMLTLPADSLKRDDFATVCCETVKLGTLFLCNSYFHLYHRQSNVMSDMVTTVDGLLNKEPLANDWMLQFLSTEGLKYQRSFLLECTFREVRLNFATLIESALKAFLHHHGNTSVQSIQVILSSLVGLVADDAPNHCKNSGQLFWLLRKVTEMGIKQCEDLMAMNLFPMLIKFLLGVHTDPGPDFNPTSHRRRWSSAQAKGFGDLHSIIARIILACDLSEIRDQDFKSVACSVPDSVFSKSEKLICAIPQSLIETLQGPVSGIFIKECITACREVSSGVDDIIIMLTNVSFCSKSLSETAMRELMKQYNTVNSGELKNLSKLLSEILSIEDPIQTDRLRFAIEGESQSDVKGVFEIVKDNQNSDTCRAYQCIKTLVNASNRSIAVKEYLLQNSEQWQWSVNWLKSKMENEVWAVPFSGDADTLVSSTTNGKTGSEASSSISNEDSTTRTFHRTTSAQVTLEEANAILAGFSKETVEEVFQMETGGDSIEEGSACNEEDDEMPDLQNVPTFK